GQAGDDVLHASAGDTLQGGKGDDRYVFSGDDLSGTSVSELGSSGADEGGFDTLDFSQTSADVTFTIDSAIHVAVAAQTLSNIQNIERVVGGSGNTTYAFSDNWLSPLVIDNGEPASVTLDFSLVTKSLHFTIKQNGTVEVLDAAGNRVTIHNVDNIQGGQANNIYKIEDGGSIAGNLIAAEASSTGTHSLDYSDWVTLEPTVTGQVVISGHDFVSLATHPVTGKGQFSLDSNGDYRYTANPETDFADLSNDSSENITVQYKAVDANGDAINPEVSQTLSLTVARDSEGQLSVAVNGAEAVDVPEIPGLTVDLSDADTVAGQVTGFGGTVSGINELRGTQYKDQLSAGTVDSNVFGTANDDNLNGGSGDDLVFGGAGSDVLTGGAGADGLAGGDGDDTYVFSGEWGQDVDQFTVIAAEDSSGTTITIGALTTLPSGAQLTIQSDGSYIYNPGTAFDGEPAGKPTSDSFKFTVENDAGFSESYTKTLTVVRGEIAVDVGTVKVDSMATGLALNGLLDLNSYLAGNNVEITGFGQNTTNFDPDSSVILTQALSNLGSLIVKSDGSYSFVVNNPDALDQYGETLTINFKISLKNDSGQSQEEDIALTFTAQAGSDGLLVREGGNKATNGSALTVSEDNGLTSNTNLSVKGVTELADGGSDTL
ncbi:MAG: hypothetical protein VXZ35_12920, partial [Pseudomonadota bacterium]|nr:hypothetical protein [Pseudomonadota bacterium]